MLKSGLHNQQTVRGSTTQDAKSSDKLNFLSLGPNPTVLETMDTTAYPYCYTCKRFKFKAVYDIWMTADLDTTPERRINALLSALKNKVALHHRDG